MDVHSNDLVLHFSYVIIGGVVTPGMLNMKMPTKFLGGLLYY